MTLTEEHTTQHETINEAIKKKRGRPSWKAQVEKVLQTQKALEAETVQVSHTQSRRIVGEEYCGDQLIARVEHPLPDHTHVEDFRPSPYQQAAEYQIKKAAQLTERERAEEIEATF